jgi:hypothetical protein
MASETAEVTLAVEQIWQLFRLICTFHAIRLAIRTFMTKFPAFIAQALKLLYKETNLFFGHRS